MTSFSDLPKDVYFLRQQIARIRQAQTIQELAQLGNHVNRTPHHPYGHDEELPPGWKVGSASIYQGLMRQDPFRSGYRMWQVTPPVEHLYRLSNVDALMSAMDPKGDTAAPLRQNPYWNGEIIFPKKGVKSAEDTFTALQNASRNRWVDLSEHLIGTLRTERTVTWWSSYKFSPATFYEDRLLAGMFQNLVRPVILRINLAKLTRYLDDLTHSRNASRLDAGHSSSCSDVLFPLEVDAYAYPVFHAYNPQVHPQGGMSIDLRNRKRLKPGCTEYVIHNAPISCIEIRAGVHNRDRTELDPENRTWRSAINRREPMFWNALLSYHQKDYERNTAEH